MQFSTSVKKPHNPEQIILGTALEGLYKKLDMGNLQNFKIVTLLSLIVMTAMQIAQMIFTTTTEMDEEESQRVYLLSVVPIFLLALLLTIGCFPPRKVSVALIVSTIVLASISVYFIEIQKIRSKSDFNFTLGAFLSFANANMKKMDHRGFRKTLITIFFLAYEFIRTGSAPTPETLVLSIGLIISTALVDIQSQKHMKQVLTYFASRERESLQYQDILKSLPNGIVILDHDLVIYANDCVKKTLEVDDNYSVKKAFESIFINESAQPSDNERKIPIGQNNKEDIPHNKDAVNVSHNPSIEPKSCIPASPNESLHHLVNKDNEEKFVRSKPNFRDNRGRSTHLFSFGTHFQNALPALLREKLSSLQNQEVRTLRYDKDFNHLGHNIDSFYSIPQTPLEGDHQPCDEPADSPTHKGPFSRIFRESGYLKGMGYPETRSPLQPRTCASGSVSATASQTPSSIGTLSQFLAKSVEENRDFSNRVDQEAMLEIHYQLPKAKFAGRSKQKVLDIDVARIKGFRDGKDVTLLMVTDKSYEITLGELIQLNTSKSAILAYLCHEVNTPLNIIQLILDSLKEEINPTVYNEAIQPCIDATHAMKFTMMNIIWYSKLENKEITLETSVTDINSTVQSVSQLFRSSAKEKQIEFVCDTDPNEQNYAKVDPDVLKQIVFNLISNAIKYTSKGKVEVKVTRTNVFEESYATITVTDTGKGMTREELEVAGTIKTEEYIGRVGSENTGIGLGLTVTKKLIECISPRGRGGLEMTSKVGEGSTFSFDLKVISSELPEVTTYILDQRERERARTSLILAQVNSRRDRRGQTTPSSNPHEIEIVPYRTRSENPKRNCNGFGEEKKEIASIDEIPNEEDVKEEAKIHIEIKEDGQHIQEIQIPEEPCECFEILLVDDNDFNLMALEMQLNNTGFKIGKAHDGQQAIDVLESRCSQGHVKADRCVTIFMDMNMPVMDGLTCTRILKQKMKDKLMKYIPVVLNSANSVALSNIGEDPVLFDAVAPKPLDKHKILDLINQCMSLTGPL